MSASAFLRRYHDAVDTIRARINWTVSLQIP
jgi:hypothetical protein